MKPKMLTGSVAMSHYAQPRMTRDIDLVVAPSPSDADLLVRLFETEMSDAPPKIAAMVREMMLARTGEERLAMADRMYNVARTIVMASFPDGLSNIKLKCRLCERLYGK